MRGRRDAGQRQIARDLQIWAEAQPVAGGTGAGAAAATGEAGKMDGADAWTLDSLLADVPDAPIEPLRLRADDSEQDPGQLAYLRHRAYPAANTDAQFTSRGRQPARPG